MSRSISNSEYSDASIESLSDFESNINPKKGGKKRSTTTWDEGPVPESPAFAKRIPVPAFVREGKEYTNTEVRALEDFVNTHPEMKLKSKFYRSKEIVDRHTPPSTPDRQKKERNIGSGGFDAHIPSIFTQKLQNENKVDETVVKSLVRARDAPPLLRLLASILDLALWSSLYLMLMHPEHFYTTIVIALCIHTPLFYFGKTFGKLITFIHVEHETVRGPERAGIFTMFIREFLIKPTFMIIFGWNLGLIALICSSTYVHDLPLTTRVVSDYLKEVIPVGFAESAKQIRTKLL